VITGLFTSVVVQTQEIERRDISRSHIGIHLNEVLNKEIGRVLGTNDNVSFFETKIISKNVNGGIKYKKQLAFYLPYDKCGIGEHAQISREEWIEMGRPPVIDIDDGLSFKCDFFFEDRLGARHVFFIRIK